MNEEVPVKRVTVVKLGNIGCAPLIELLLDERADRLDIDTRVFGSGAKMGEIQSIEVASVASKSPTDLFVVTSPNAGLPGPTRAREILAETGKPVIVVSDAPAKKISKDLEAKGFGFVIVMQDPMIGARREFLDPAEMAIFNGYLAVLLASTGVFELLRGAVESALNGELPRLIVSPEMAAEAMGFSNPYALAKAIGAGEIAQSLAALTVRGCFLEKEMTRYVKLVASAHEILISAVRMAEEARSIEKSNDSVHRMPHHKQGELLSKIHLLEKPRTPE